MSHRPKLHKKASASLPVLPNCQVQPKTHRVPAACISIDTKPSLLFLEGIRSLYGPERLKESYGPAVDGRAWKTADAV